MRRYFHSHDFPWIGRLSAKFAFPDEVTGSNWHVLDKLSERHCGEPNEGWESCWAQAVYTCRDANGISQDAILKVYMQIPKILDDSELLQEEGAYAAQATEEWPDPLINETNALSDLTDAQCSSTPKIFAVLPQRQGSQLWVPGGYLVAILMEKINGQNMSRVWNGEELGMSDKLKLRAAFKKAIDEFWTHGYDLLDMRPENIIWDPSQEKCYLVDFEACHPLAPGVQQKWHSEFEYSRWGMGDHELDAPLYEAERERSKRIYRDGYDKEA